MLKTALHLIISVNYEVHISSNVRGYSFFKKKPKL